MIGFYHGSALPEQTKSGIYFIVSGNKGKLYRVLQDGDEAVLIAESNNDQEFATLSAAVEQAQEDIAKNAENATKALNGLVTITSLHGETLQNITSEIDSLEEFIGELPEGASEETIVEYINKKTEGIASNSALEELSQKITQAEADIDVIEADYLTSVEEKVLQDQITANANAIELLTNGVSAEEVDGVNDLIQYVKDHGTEVTGIKEDIKTNTGNISTLSEKVETLESYFEEGEGTVADQISSAVSAEAELRETGVNEAKTAAKAADDKAVQAQNEVDALEGRVTTAEGNIEILLDALTWKQA